MPKRAFPLNLMNRLAILLAALASALPVSAAPPENLIRNGSFEGSLLYWHDPKGKQTVPEGKNGANALRIDSGWTLSAPFVAEPGATYTISLWARAAEGKARVSVAMPPTAREVAVNAKRIWNKEAGQSADLTTEWQRLSFSFPADVAQTGFWPLPHYGVYLGVGEKGPSVLVDGVTVTKGTEGTHDYLPRSRVEVLAEPTNLPGYRGAAGNMYEKGATATLDGHLHNPGDTPVKVTARWQMTDYEGVAALGDPQDTAVTLQPGETRTVPVALPLTPTGAVLARFSALTPAGEVIDSSHIPLTSLPYEKAATKADVRERFGGSFAGGVECLDRMRRIGFGWTRWWANNKWHDYEPQQGKFDWSDDKQNEAFDRGIANHVVLYGWPEWIMDKNHPLPRDMRWKTDDARWDDLTIETAWDRFVKAATEHFRGKPVVLQIANEPGHDKWKDGWVPEYVRFNIRTARLIKQTDPNARVSINNVYLNPSSVNAAFLKNRDFSDIDIWSWHDYHSGWLGDATSVKRQRTMLDGAGGKHLSIWFTEGWGFTNTLVDQPIACTGLTSVESTHAIFNSVAEMSANGHDQFVLFHLMYDKHGMSFWDYSGPGTMLWDWYDFPTALVAGWNVMNHHIGLSDAAGFVRPPGANFCIFQDLRNGRGVVYAYADRNAKEDAAVKLPLEGIVAENLMGNPVEIKDGTLRLSKTGRPVIFRTKANTSGRELLAAFETLDRKHLGFATKGEDGSVIYRIPEVWEGAEKGSAKGNPALQDGRPLWRLDRLGAGERIMPGSYAPMVWGNQRWSAHDRTQGGHPSAEVKDGAIRFGTMGPWPGDMDFKKQGAISFIAPESGLYRIRATASSQPWEGKAEKALLLVLKRDEQRVGEVKRFELPRDNSPVPIELELDLAAGHELVFLTEMPHANNATNIVLRDVRVERKR